jgi:hypothetical protein
VDQIPQAGPAAESSDGFEDTIVYRVVCTNAETAKYEALTDGDIPAIGDEHPVESTIVAHRITSQMETDPLIYLVSVEYATPTEFSPAPNPLDDRVQIRWSHQTYTEPVINDRNGAAAVNSAGDWFDPGIEREKHILILNVARNEAFFNPATAEAYVDTVNSDVTTIAGLPITARQGKIMEYSAERLERNGHEYWAVIYRLEFKGDTWDSKKLDQGLHYLAGGVKYPITVAGEPATEAQLLDGSGAVLAVAGTPVFITFETNDQAVFGNLGLNI